MTFIYLALSSLCKRLGELEHPIKSAIEMERKGRRCKKKEKKMDKNALYLRLSLILN